MGKSFYTLFPQFCPEAVNDVAWYPGFTDWDLIKQLPQKQRDRFTPARGYYDLSNSSDIRATLAELKAIPGAGAALYHYFFDGHFLLDSVERLILERGCDCPEFFLIWANETWSKRWVGKPGEIIIRQNHSLSQSVVGTHMSRLCALMQHPAYFRIDDRPLFIIYAGYEIASVPEFLATYREAFRSRGVNPLIGFCASYVDPHFDAGRFDFCVEFHPRLFFNTVRASRNSQLSSLALSLKRSWPRVYDMLTAIRDRGAFLTTNGARELFAYEDFIELAIAGTFRNLLSASYSLPSIPCSFYSWNNFPRYRSRSVRVTHGTDDYHRFMSLKHLYSQSAPWSLINSWNEWSEGAALEPGAVDIETFELRS
jgi:hypothetical protein